MIQALLYGLHPRWRRRVEVPVYRPARGVIDAVLEDPVERVVVAVEAQSELRRLEPQVRWAMQKADALALAPTAPRRPIGPTDGPASLPITTPRGEDGDLDTEPVSRLLLLRSVRSTRRAAGKSAGLLAVAYPARHEDLVAALAGRAPWHGSGIVSCEVESGKARLMLRPPQGVVPGR